MSGTELILPGADAPLMLPPAQHPIAQLLYDKAAQLPRILPHNVDPGAFIMACAREVNKLKKDVDPATVMVTVANCAVVGLIPGEALGHAYFIPFRNNKRNGIQECQLVVGYKGFLSLAYGSGFLADVHCEVVLEGESWKRWNDESGPRLEHELLIDRNLDYNAVQAAYCVWHSRAGGRGVTVIGRKELNAINTHRNVWNSNPIQMALKSPLRGAAKLWDTTNRMGAAVTLDGLAEAGVSQPALPGTEGTVVDVEPARPSLADMAPEAPEPTPEAVATSAQRLDEYHVELHAAVRDGLTARVDDLADHALTNGDLDPTGKVQVEKWATDARKHIKAQDSK